MVKLAAFIWMEAVYFRQFKGLFTTDNGLTFIRKPTTCAMKNITILVPETAVIEAVADPRYAFTAVNEFLKSTGGADVPCAAGRADQ